MKPEVLKMINRAALFADENEDFRIPSEPDADQQVTLRFRTARGDVDSVYYVENGQKTEKPAVEGAPVISSLITTSVGYWWTQCRLVIISMW